MTSLYQSKQCGRSFAQALSAQSSSRVAHEGQEGVLRVPRTMFPRLVERGFIQALATEHDKPRLVRSRGSCLDGINMIRL